MKSVFFPPTIDHHFAFSPGWSRSESWKPQLTWQIFIFPRIESHRELDRKKQQKKTFFPPGWSRGESWTPRQTATPSWASSLPSTASGRTSSPRRCVACVVLSSLRGLRGAPVVPPLCRETSVSRTANVERTGGHKWVRDARNRIFTGLHFSRTQNSYFKLQM